MSAETRYRTLVANMSAIYASTPETRTQLLHNGLIEIVNVIKPLDDQSWNMVKTDSERLLKVWYSSEDENSYAKEVVDQLVSLLMELAAAPAPAPAPGLFTRNSTG